MANYRLNKKINRVLRFIGAIGTTEEPPRGGVKKTKADLVFEELMLQRNQLNEVHNQLAAMKTALPGFSNAVTRVIAGLELLERRTDVVYGRLNVSRPVSSRTEFLEALHEFDTVSDRPLMFVGHRMLTEADTTATVLMASDAAIGSTAEADLAEARQEIGIPK